MTNSALSLHGPVTQESNLAERYLQLLKDALLGLTGQMLHAYPNPTSKIDRAAYRILSKLLSFRRVELTRRVEVDVRTDGRDWPVHALTMIGGHRLDNLHDCIRSVLDDGVAGDFLEAGVWRGGACIFMRGALLAYGDKNRQVWVADSFEGLPPPNPTAYPADRGDELWKRGELAVSLAQVEANFARFGLLDDRVRFLQGWFRNTLPQAPITNLAILRLDGDLYESTIDSLQSLYPKLSVGGYVIVDDYGAQTLGGRQAVDDFRASNKVSDPMVQIDWTGWYWRRT
jgi:O-methyltransferase